jgi:hypothetical protein
MRHSLHKTIAAALLLAASAAPAVSQIAVYDRATRAIQFRGDQSNNTTQVIYTVPAGREFHVTDLIASNWGSGICLVYFPGKTTEMIVPADTTKHFSFLSGPAYGGGVDVYIGNDARLPVGANCNWTFTVMGYQRVRN